ncbi:hypothetical protein H0H93_005132 [Arthromyces matolae]|nr:hypothetical protein H0H93_005132 [Arthromyces matolae]
MSVSAAALATGCNLVFEKEPAYFDVRQNSVLAIPTQPGGGNHTIDFTHSAQTKPAHEDGMNVTKALALTGLRVLTDDAFFAEVKAAFEAVEEIGNRPHARPRVHARKQRCSWVSWCSESISYERYSVPPFPKETANGIILWPTQRHCSLLLLTPSTRIFGAIFEEKRPWHALAQGSQFGTSS